MTEITKYRCDICGAVYDDETKCEACEEFHVSPSSVYGVAYKPIDETNIPYPAFVRFTMDDGSIIEYIYRSLVSGGASVTDSPSDEPDESIEPEEPDDGEEGEE